VADAAYFLTATAGPDDRDAICLEEDPPDFFSGLAPRPLAGARVALSLDMDGHAIIDTEVAAALSETADILRDLGCEIIEACPPVDFGPGTSPMNPADEYAFDPSLFDDHFDELTPYAQAVLKAGKETTAVQYAGYWRWRERYRRSVGRWFNDYDFFLTPAAAHAAGPISGDLKEINGTPVPPAWVIWYTRIWNLTGHPAASVPAGFSASGLPLAVQIVGRMGDEPSVLALSAALERARPWAGKWPELAKADYLSS
jgi:Asp-tRNA(Asn)/Glu-tRNA(Gln) amidotransferase A subunit family amidase